MNLKRELKSLFRKFAILCTTLFLLNTALVNAQMPPSISGDTYIIRKDKPGPCKFASVYQRIKSKKSDPRVAYIELYNLVHANEAPSSFYSLCTSISEQAEDNVVVYDRAHAFLHILWGDEADINDAVAYFSSTTKTPGIILFVTRYAEDWRAFVFIYEHKKWNDVTAKYLGQLQLGKRDYIVVPQYGHSARVLSYHGNRFHHKMWLTWDGKKFTPSTAKKMPGWRCPDSYRYFAPSERKQYCQ
jgi:hypothetical protein